MAGNTNSDPFEEFEFRPINEGLGFHRKQKATTPAAQTSSKTASKPATAASFLLDETTSAKTIFNSPLPRSSEERADSRLDARAEARFETRLDSRSETLSRPQIQIPTIEDDSISKAQTAVNDILKNLNQKRQLDFAEATAKQKTEYKKSRPQLFAAVLDGMLIVSAFLLSLIIMLSVTKVDLFMNLSHPGTSGMIYVATAGLFLSIYFVYMVVNRAFTGYTPGEWAFDQVCGRQGQTEQLSYIPRLVLRTVLVAVTGFITLPFLSFLFNKDIAGSIVGMPLMQKPHG